MATLSPTRPSRRVAAKKNVVASDSNEDDVVNDTVAQEDDEDEFTPAPARSPKRLSRRRTNDMPSTPRTATRNRRTKTGEDIEPPEMFKANETVLSTPVSPTKKVSPRKRRSTALTKTSCTSKSSEIPVPPSPHISIFPEPFELLSQPLSDITNSTINEQAAAPESQKSFVKVKPLDTILEKPMDIVVRTRALGVPMNEDIPTSKTRTVIKYLILINFKSYAGRQEVGPFHASFSSVVGPNGSGKSNVIDSLLFVFGFRASKMRQGKISALIHNSAAFPNLDFCEVEVHFEEVMDLPNGKHEAVLGSALTISRKAFKNNSSKYYLNSRESNFTAVTTLLKDKGVDLDHKRFLILQGEVESIAQMKPKAANEHDDGLLEYLEDIIGTSKYKAPIEESALEVDMLNEVCVEKSARVQHVEKEKNSLEDKKNTALAYVRDENELTSKQSMLYQVYVNECNDNLKVTEEAIEQAQDQLSEELGKHQGNEDEMNKLDKIYKKGQKAYELLEKNNALIVNEMARFEKEKVKLEEKKRFLTGKQKKLEKALLSSRLAISEASSLIRKFSDDVERTDAEVTSLEIAMTAESNELASIRESLTGKTQAFSDEISVKQKQLEPWNEKINQKQSAIAVMQSELGMLRERASAGEVALQGLNNKKDGIRSAVEGKTVELVDIKSKKAQFEKEARIMQQEIARLAERDPELRSQLSSARQKADEARASLSNSQSQGNVLNGLLRLKESGRIEGFHSRLGNLGAVDPKYDVAISTACPALENLVVDSVEVGQQCIDYLRKNSLGRANFVLLDRLAQRDMSSPDTPEGVPRLFDLIKVKDAIFKPAFFSVLQNTLVANNLDQANRIAYGIRRWRVVTLDGQLIDVSGTMSGGGTRVVRGGMSSKLAADTTKDQVQRLEVDRDALEQQFQAFQENQRSLETLYKDLLNQVPFLETKIQKISLEIDSLSRNQSDTKRRIEELTTRQRPSKPDDAHIANLLKQLSVLEEELFNLHSESAGLEQEIKGLQDKIMKVGGVRLRGQKAKVDGLKEQINTLNEEMSNAEVSKSKAIKDKAKHEKAHAQAQKDLSAATEEFGELDKEGSSQTADAVHYKAKAEEAQSALDDKKEELDSLKKDLEQKSAQLNETRAIEIEMKNKLEENHKVLAENQKRLRYWEEKLGGLILQAVR